MYKEELKSAFDNFALSKEFGWTPTQIEKLTFDERMMYLGILQGSNKPKK